MEIAAGLGLVAIVTAFVYTFVRRAPLSLTLAIAVLTVFTLLAATSASWGNPVASPAYWDLVLLHSGRWRSEEVLTFFTTMFVHENLLHLTFNMGALILIGTALEERIGTTAFTTVFIVGGLAGTSTFYLIHYSESFRILGASGAISAVLGAYARLYPRDKLMLFLPIPLPPIPAIWMAAGFLIFSSILVYMVPNIAHEAHIGGLLTGLLIAPLAARLPSKRKVTVRELDTEIMAMLAKTRELREILDKIKAETVPEVRDVWVERYFKQVKCPKCNGPLKIGRSSVTSQCGWRRRLR